MKHPPEKELLQSMDDFYIGLQQCLFHVHASFSANLGSEQYFYQHDPSPRQIIHGERIREGENTVSPHFHIHRKAYQIRPDIGVCTIATPTMLLGCLSGGLIPTPLLWEEAVRELGMTLSQISYENWKTIEQNSEFERGLEKADVICIPHVGALVVGGSFGQILYRLQVLERLANMMIIVKQIGKGKILTPTQAQNLIPQGRRPSHPNHKNEDIYNSTQTSSTDDWERW